MPLRLYMRHMLYALRALPAMLAMIFYAADGSAIMPLPLRLCRRHAR